MISNDLKYKLADVNAAMARHAKARKTKEVEKAEVEVWKELQELVAQIQDALEQKAWWSR